jgi:hypothetical protein
MKNIGNCILHLFGRADGEILGQGLSVARQSMKKR